jgi:hypothetical protein
MNTYIVVGEVSFLNHVCDFGLQEILSRAVRYMFRRRLRPGASAQEKKKKKRKEKMETARGSYFFKGDTPACDFLPASGEPRHYRVALAALRRDLHCAGAQQRCALM